MKSPAAIRGGVPAVSSRGRRSPGAVQARRPLGGDVSSDRKDWVFRFTLFVAGVALRPFFRLEIQGEENLPRDRGFVLLPKHQRWEDIPLLSLAAKRPLYYVAKVELFRKGFCDWFLRSLGGLPLNREKPLAGKRYLQAMLTLLGEGEGVVVFPEGTYFRDRMGPGQVGIVRLILSRQPMPFIPVGIRYSGGRGRCLVQVRFGRALHAEKSASPKEFVDEIMARIAELSEFSPAGC